MCLGVPGRIREITNEEPLTRSGLVEFEGISKEINLALVEEANVGDYVIVHAGFALSKVDEEEAKQVFQYLKEMGELADLAEDES